MLNLERCTESQVVEPNRVKWNVQYSAVRRDAVCCTFRYGTLQRYTLSLRHEQTKPHVESITPSTKVHCREYIVVDTVLSVHSLTVIWYPGYEIYEINTPRRIVVTASLKLEQDGGAVLPPRGTTRRPHDIVAVCRLGVHTR